MTWFALRGVLDVEMKFNKWHLGVLMPFHYSVHGTDKN